MQPQALSANLVAAAAVGDKGAVDQALRDLGAARDELHAKPAAPLRMMRNVWRRRLRTSTLSYLHRQLLRKTHIQEALSALSGALATDALATDALATDAIATDALAKEAAQAQAELARLVDAVNGKHADKIPPLLLHALLQKNSNDR